MESAFVVRGTQAGMAIWPYSLVEEKGHDALTSGFRCVINEDQDTKDVQDWATYNEMKT